jgi:hypothetical protein
MTGFTLKIMSLLSVAFKTSSMAYGKILFGLRCAALLVFIRHKFIQFCEYPFLEDASEQQRAMHSASRCLTECDAAFEVSSRCAEMQ